MIKFKYNLPVNYKELHWSKRKEVREQYIQEQNNMCMFCKSNLFDTVPEDILNKKINWRLFPPNFLDHPIHLQHDHKTGMTEGAIHAYCNAVLWQYYNK